MTTTTRTELPLTEMTKAIRSMSPDEHTGMLYYLLGYAGDDEYAPSLAVRHALSNAVSLRLELRAKRDAR